MQLFKEFVEYITEAGGAGEIADAKGKAFELELAKNLHPKQQYPKHHNDETGRSPEAVASDLRNRLGHDEYEKVSGHAAKAAKEYLAKTKHAPSEVHWTSVEGQVSKTTGKNDAGNQSDLVYKHGKEHHGISAKYGSAPGARSPGMKDLASMSGMKHEHLQKLIDAHHEAIHSIMAPHVKSTSNAQRHKEFKEIASGAKGSKAKAASDLASKTSLEHRSAIAGHLANHFSKLAKNDHAGMTEVVRKLTASHGTETPMMKVHHNPKTGKTDVSNPKEDFDNAMSKVKHFSVEHKGMYIHIHAHDHEGNKHSIAKLSIKNKSSSPYTNMVGSSSLGSGLKKLAAQ
jgi:hypothetical protein